MCLINLKSGSLVSERPLIITKILKALKLFIVESSSAIIKKTILYYSSVRHRSLSLSYLIRFANSELAYTSAICLEIAVKKSFITSVPSILISLITCLCVLLLLYNYNWFLHALILLLLLYFYICVYLLLACLISERRSCRAFSSSWGSPPYIKHILAIN